MIYTKNCVICGKEFQTKEIKVKTCCRVCSTALMHKTMTERHGAPNPLQCKAIREKAEATCIQRYGFKNALQNKSIEAKRRQTNIKKYGFENAMENKDIQAKQHATNKERYNCKVASQRHMTNFDDFNKEYILEHFTTDGVVTLKDRMEFMKYFNIKNIKSALYRLKQKGVPAQLGHNFSVKEKEILNFLKERYPHFTFIENDRTTINRPNTRYYLEIDILIKKGNDIICGVEYNGNYYHEKEDESKETLKTQLCKEAGFPLFHIWEDSVEDDLFEIIEILDEI